MKAMQVIPLPSTPAPLFSFMQESCEDTGPQKGTLIFTLFLNPHPQRPFAACRGLGCARLITTYFSMYNCTGPRVSS